MENLTIVQKRTLAEEIKKLDRKGEIVTLSPNADFTGSGIVYRKDSGVTLGENMTRLKDEEYVRDNHFILLDSHAQCVQSDFARCEAR